DPGEGPSTGP
nr:Chain B, Epstein-Barr nuclear antigen-1 [synthetic construct]